MSSLVFIVEKQESRPRMVWRNEDLSTPYEDHMPAGGRHLDADSLARRVCLPTRDAASSVTPLYDCLFWRKIHSLSKSL
jgi:hypothetical protein